MASIKRRRGKYHVVYYYLNEDGEKKQKWESFDTEAEAKHRKAEIEYKQGSRIFIAPSKTTVAAFLEDFVSLYGTKKWSPSTYEANTGLIRNYINPKLGSTLMQDVTSIAADRFISALQKTKCPTYKNRYAGLLLQRLDQNRRQRKELLGGNGGRYERYGADRWLCQRGD